MANFRPISLISNLAKILEKHVKKHLVKFLEKNKIISPNQYGFCNNMGTDNAIADLTKDIYDALDKGEKPLVIFLDLAKAFDTVCHKKLIHKIAASGISATALKWFESYLDHREQQVRIKNHVSEPRTTTHGIPQGTALGPVLFSIFIIDLLKTNLLGKIKSFADDTILFSSSKKWDETFISARNDFKVLKSWLDLNGITINFQKTCYISFSWTKSTQPIDEGQLVID